MLQTVFTAAVMLSGGDQPQGQTDVIDESEQALKKQRLDEETSIFDKQTVEEAVEIREREIGKSPSSTGTSSAPSSSSSRRGSPLKLSSGSPIGHLILDEIHHGGLVGDNGKGGSNGLVTGAKRSYESSSSGSAAPERGHGTSARGEEAGVNESKDDSNNEREGEVEPETETEVDQEGLSDAERDLIRKKLITAIFNSFGSSILNIVSDPHARQRPNEALPSFEAAAGPLCRLSSSARNLSSSPSSAQVDDNDPEEDDEKGEGTGSEAEGECDDNFNGDEEDPHHGEDIYFDCDEDEDAGAGLSEGYMDVEAEHEPEDREHGDELQLRDVTSIESQRPTSSSLSSGDRWSLPQQENNGGDDDKLRRTVGRDSRSTSIDGHVALTDNTTPPSMSASEHDQDHEQDQELDEYTHATSEGPTVPPYPHGKNVTYSDGIHRGSDHACDTSSDGDDDSRTHGDT
jgi:hypothetical protein